MASYFYKLSSKPSYPSSVPIGKNTTIMNCSKKTI